MTIGIPITRWRSHQVCRYFRDLIAHAVVLQYKLELAATGMLDRGGSTLPVVERLARLREYHAALAINELGPPHILYNHEHKNHYYDLGYGDASGDAWPYTLPDRSGAGLYLPLSSAKGIREKTWTLPSTESVPFGSGRVYAIAVDLKQDLIVVVVESPVEAVQP